MEEQNMENGKSTRMVLSRRLNTNLKAKVNKNQRRIRNNVKTKLKRNIRGKMKKLSSFKIFKRLILKDLVNITAPSKEFTESLLSVFKYNYANDMITVTNVKEDKRLLPLSTSLLNHFGNLVKKLRLKYDDEYHRFAAGLEKAIFKNCRNSVTEIEFINFDQFAFLDIKKPFPMVEKVVFTRCTFGKIFFEFNKWFPNAQSLDFAETKILRQKDAMKCLKQTFPRRADVEDNDGDGEWEDENEWEDDDQDRPCADPKKMNQDELEEMLCKEFEAKCLGPSWQLNYTSIENGLWVKYEKR